MIQIKQRFTWHVICEFDVATVIEAVLLAINSGANLSGANLSGANLYGADLSGANLYGADLYGANLSSANLYGADLSSADLSGANLSRANLYGANLSGANLYGANLYGANLSSANLYGADLSSANLYGANLYGANLYGAKTDDLYLAQNSIVSEGRIIVWKKLRNNVIAKLCIPENAKRLNSIGSRKCRAEFAFVLELSNSAESEFDQHSGKLEYKIGEFVYPDKFDDSVFTECSNGIHFFLTRIEAENY